MIREARAKGLPLTAETCPHYVYFSSEKIPDADTRFKCAPPIRDAANNQLLWDALTDHTLDFIVTDHSPAPPETKELDSGDLKAAWGGIASIQFAIGRLDARQTTQEYPGRGRRLDEYTGSRFFRLA